MGTDMKYIAFVLGCFFSFAALAQQVPNPLSADGANAVLPAAKENINLDPTKNYYSFGDALYPIYATKTSTTVNATNGVKTITVANATGINVGDLIEGSFAYVAYVYGSHHVASIVGTTITMTEPATAGGTNLPAGFGTDYRFQSKNSLLTNVLAAQVGNFGTASRGHSTWVSDYQPWTDLNWASIFSISPIGQAAGFFGARSSDNSAGYMIPLTCFAVGNNPTLAIYSWCQYLESHLEASVPLAYQSFHIQIESSVNNGWTISGDSTPFNVNAGPIFTSNLRLDNGIGNPGVPKPMTVAMDIINNGGTYRTGILIDATALDMTGRSFAPAISMGPKHAVCWFLAAGPYPNWCMKSDNDDGTQSFRVVDVYRGRDTIKIEQSTGFVKILGQIIQTDDKSAAITTDSEGLVVYSKPGSPTPLQMRQMTSTYAGPWGYSPIAGVVTNTTGTTLADVFGISGYAINQNAAGAGLRNAGGLFGECVSAVDGAACWGINTIQIDNTSYAGSSGASRFLANEFDFNVTSPSTAVSGLILIGASIAQPYSANGFSCAPLSDPNGTLPNPIHWTSCFLSDNGAAQFAFVAGAAARSGTNIGSQEIAFNYFDGAATGQRAALSVTGGVPRTLALTTTGASGSLGFGVYGDIYSVHNNATLWMGAALGGPKAALSVNSNNELLVASGAWNKILFGAAGGPTPTYITGLATVAAGTGKHFVCMDAATGQIYRGTGASCN